jgi:hypothetical protein
MVYRAENVQLIVLCIGAIALIIGIITFFRGIRRDKIISWTVVFICSVFYFIAEYRIQKHYAQAELFIGKYKLKNFRGSEDFWIEILPDRNFYIYNRTDTVRKDVWDLVINKDQDSKMIVLPDGILGVGKYKLNLAEKTRN